MGNNDTDSLLTLLQLTQYTGGCEPYQITFANDEDLPQIIDIVRELRQTKVIQHSPRLCHVLLDAGILGPKSSYASSNAPLSDPELATITKNLYAGRWNLYGAMHGPKRIRNALWPIITEAFSRVEGAKFYLPGDIHHSALNILSKTLRGIPTMDEVEWTKWIPNGSHVFFRLMSDVSGEIANAQYTITKKRIQEAGFDFMGTFTINLRQMHNILYIVYESYDPDSRRSVHKLIRTLMDYCEKNGWTEYMTHGALMDQIIASQNILGGNLVKIKG